MKQEICKCGKNINEHKDTKGYCELTDSYVGEKYYNQVEKPQEEIGKGDSESSKSPNSSVAQQPNESISDECEQEWIATEWSHKSQYDLMSKSSSHIKIVRLNSQYYKGDRFAVRDVGNVLSVKGNWSYEPQPSSRTKKFYEKYRFTSFKEAVKLATKEVNKNEK